MRSNGRFAVLTGMLVLASACSDGGNTSPPDNAAPKASFDVPACLINVPCEFKSTSTDDAAVTEWSWDFDGDGHADQTTATASFTYTAPGDYDVSLTVHDAQGLSDTKTSTITIAPPVNPPPTAAFTPSCTAATCSFTSTSSDAAPGSIAAYDWDFGDGSAHSSEANPSHTYDVTAATNFTVTLTVTDNEGAIGVATQTVSVTPPANTPPTAAFTYTCNNASCSFSSTSTDAAPGTITTYAWDFGDHGTATVMNPLHSYAITSSKDFTVTLTVTDNDGLTGTTTQTITVSPPAPTAEGCTTFDTYVDCVFNITAKSNVQLTLLAISCNNAREAVTIPPPIGDQTFLSACSLTPGTTLKIYGGPTDSAIIYEAGSQLRIRLKQGVARTGEPPPGPPAARFEGSFPNWTIFFEDGGNPGDPGEPDFSDLVVGVQALPLP
jgi:PKD repeat protein